MTLKRIVIMFLPALVAATFLNGCAAGTQWVWKSSPEKQLVSNEYFDAEITPFGYFGLFGFDLSITNKTDKNIEVNWIKTLYIQGGKSSGGFVLSGVDYKDRNNPRPTEIIIGKGKYTNRIDPEKWAVFKNGTWIHYKEMPEGENGILLCVVVEGKEILEKLTVNLYKFSEKN